MAILTPCSQCVRALSRVQLFATPWTAVHWAPLSMGFPRKKYGSGLLFHPPGDLHEPGIKTVSLISSALAGGFFTTSTTWPGYSLQSSCLENSMDGGTWQVTVHGITKSWT